MSKLILCFFLILKCIFVQSSIEIIDDFSYENMGKVFIIHRIFVPEIENVCTLHVPITFNFNGRPKEGFLSPEKEILDQTEEITCNEHWHVYIETNKFSIWRKETLILVQIFELSTQPSRRTTEPTISTTASTTTTIITSTRLISKLLSYQQAIMQDKDSLIQNTLLQFLVHFVDDANDVIYITIIISVVIGFLISKYKKFILLKVFKDIKYFKINSNSTDQNTQTEYFDFYQFPQHAQTAQKEPSAPLDAISNTSNMFSPYQYQTPQTPQNFQYSTPNVNDIRNTNTTINGSMRLFPIPEQIETMVMTKVQKPCNCKAICKNNCCDCKKWFAKCLPECHSGSECFHK
jgi:hypothetical protein